MRDIGKNIKTLRMAKGMTQEDLAAALFVTRQTVSNYENGRSRPDLDMLLNIAQVLDTDATAILYGPPQPPCRKPALIRLAVGGAALAVVWGGTALSGGTESGKIAYCVGDTCGMGFTSSESVSAGLGAAAARVPHRKANAPEGKKVGHLPPGGSGCDCCGGLDVPAGYPLDMRRSSQ